jgi:plastocyanin
VPRGTQVTFTNQDSLDHEIDSDPHPEHSDCPEINQVDYLTPGQSRQTGNLNIARTCGFHDHMHPDQASMKGRIVIQ